MTAENQKQSARWDNQNSQQLPGTCDKAPEKSRVEGAIGFGFVSYWLKNWRAIFEPITKRSNCNREISFNSHLKIGLTVGEPAHWLFCCMVCSHKKKLFFLKPVINPYFLTAYHRTGDPLARITVRQLVSLWIVREKSYLAGQNWRKHPIIFKE